MRFYGILCVLVVLVMVLAPVAALHNGVPVDIGDGTSTAKGNQSTTGGSKNTGTEDDGSIKVLAASTGKVEVLSKLEYVCGAVAAEMPASYHTEALKAQAAACYTYALRMKMQQEQSPDSKLKGAYISDDSSTHQGYISEDQRRQKWGAKFDIYEKKVEDAVKEVIGKVITSEDEPILAAFHQLSPGKTESAETVWGEDIPYLQSVVSPGDRLSPDYSESVVLTQAQFSQAAEALAGADLSGDASKWAGKSKKSNAGTVTEITVGGKVFTGTKFRSAFNLRSAAFDIEYKNKSFIIHTTGYGHAVGMSQYGADYMARQGSSWEEIIKHYYTGVTIAESS